MCDRLQVTVEVIYVTVQACLYTCIVYFACGEPAPPTRLPSARLHEEFACCRPEMNPSSEYHKGAFLIVVVLTGFARDAAKFFWFLLYLW